MTPLLFAVHLASRLLRPPEREGVEEPTQADAVREEALKDCELTLRKEIAAIVRGSGSNPRYQGLRFQSALNALADDIEKNI